MKMGHNPKPGVTSASKMAISALLAVAGGDYLDEPVSCQSSASYLSTRISSVSSCLSKLKVKALISS